MHTKIKDIRNKKCKECVRFKNTGKVCVSGKGKINSKIVLIGESPGPSESSIELLDTAMLDLGYPIQKLFVTSAIRCHLFDNLEPSSSCINSCRHYLLEELEVIKPKLIIPMGNIALRSLIKKSGITKYAGRLFTYQGNGWEAMIVPNVLPLAVIRNPKNLNLFASSLERAIKYLEGNIKKQKIKYKILTSIKSINLMCDKIQEKKKVATDVETDSLYYWRLDKDMVSISFTFKKGIGYFIPLYHDETPFTDAQIKKIFHILHERIFRKKSILKIAHNIKFEMNWLRRYKCLYKGKVFDTMISDHLLDENKRHDLDGISLVITDYGEYWKEADPYKKRGEMSKMPIKKLAKYNCIDTDVTYRKYLIDDKKLKKDKGLSNVFNYILMPATFAFSEIEANGMLIDVKYLPKLQKKFERVMETQLKKLSLYRECKRYEKYRKKNDDKFVALNFNSSQQICDLLFKYKKGFRFEKKNEFKSRKTGKLSTDFKITLTPLLDIDESGFIFDLVQYRKVKKLYGTYVKGIWKHLDKNNYVHPSFSLIGSVTGRPSCSDPNVQNIPKKDIGDYDTYLKKYIKRLFIAPKGYTLVEFDQSQMELRVLAVIAHVKRMIKYFNQGKDIHAATAADISKKSIDKITKIERDNAKTTNFAIIYMIGMYALSKQMSRPKEGLYYSVQDVEDFVESYFEKLPEIKKYINRMQKQAIKQGYVRTLFGRKRRLPDVHSNVVGIADAALRQAVNAPIQGTAVDITTFNIVNLMGYLDGVRKVSDQILFCNMVYDSKMIYVPDNILDKSLYKIKAISENPPLKEYFGFDFSVPLKVDANAGKSWDNLKEIEV